MGELVGGAAASFAGFALALERLTVSASRSPQPRSCGLAVISGISAEEMSTLTMAFSAAGVSSGEMQTSLRRFAQTVTTDLAKVRQEMAGVGDTSATSAIRVKEATNALNKVMGESITYNEKDLAIQKARVALSEAQHTAAQGQANDIRRALGYFDDLAKGVKTSTDGMNLSLENLKKGLIASLGEGVEKLNDFTGSLRASADPSAQQMLLKLADIFHNMPDGIQKTALATQLFGRSVGPDLIAFLSQGSAAIEAARQRIIDLGLTLNDTEQGALKRFRIANFELADTLDRLKEKFSAAVSPAFTKALEDANHFLEEHTDDIVHMGEMTLNILTKLGDAWTAILPPIKLFGAAIGYASDAGAQLIDWGVRFTNWITDYLVPGLRTAVDWVDKLIDVFLRLIGVRGQSDTIGTGRGSRCWRSTDGARRLRARARRRRCDSGAAERGRVRDVAAGGRAVGRRADAVAQHGTWHAAVCGGRAGACDGVRWCGGWRAHVHDQFRWRNIWQPERPGCRAGAARARRRAATAFLDRAKTELEAVMSSPGSMSSTAAISGRSPWYVHQSKCSPGLHLNCD